MSTLEPDEHDVLDATVFPRRRGINDTEFRQRFSERFADSFPFWRHCSYKCDPKRHSTAILELCISMHVLVSWFWRVIIGNRKFV